MHPTPAITQDIQRRLSAAEAEHDVKVIYACESGSRAWGFASPDSDYDVRFIYAHHAQWYLAFDVERQRDVIEYPIVDEIDINGWDIRKALGLFTRSNGALLEWLQSPISYRRVGDTAERLLDVARRQHNPLALRYHYRSVARSAAGEHFNGEEVKLKKYLYALRALLALNYIEAGLGLPPMEFKTLLDAIAPKAVHRRATELVERKRNTPELGMGPTIPELNSYIHAELDRLEGELTPQGRPVLDGQEMRTELNEIFRSAISWHEGT